MEDVGGFFAILKMQTDDASFAKGASALTNIAGILKGFALLKVGEGMMQLLSAMSKINEQQAMLNTTSAQIGISTIELKTWQIMADMVGGSADGMASSLKGLMDITANLGRGITPDNQKFIDMMGVLGVTQWKGRAPTDLAQNLLDNAMQKIRSARGSGDKVGEARVRNAIDALLGSSGNALITAGITQGWSTQQMLARAGGPLMTNQKQIQGAIGPMVDMNLFNSTVKEAQTLFATKFTASVDPALKEFLEYIKANKGDIIQTISDLATVFGGLTREIIGFLSSLVQAAIVTDKLLHGKLTGKDVDKLGDSIVNLFPKVIRDWVNDENTGPWMDRQRAKDRIYTNAYGNQHLYPGQAGSVKVQIDLTPDAKRLLHPISGMRQVNDSSSRLQQSGG